MSAAALIALAVSVAARQPFDELSTGGLPPDRDHTSAVALGDADGDLDMLCGDRARQNRLSLNLLRQLDTLGEPRVGGTHRVDLYARYGPSRAMDFSWSFVSAGTATLPLPPFGVVGIDPTSMIALPPVVIPQPAGIGTATLAIPNDPNLAGVAVFTQALLEQRPVQVRLTNVVGDRIAR